MSTDNNFNSISRDAWKEMRQGTPFQQIEPVCKLGTDFHGSKKGEGIDFKSLVEFIKRTSVDIDMLFNWNGFAVKPTIIPSSRVVSTVVSYSTQEKIITNNTPFEYKDKDNKIIQADLQGRLNKNICYIEDDKYSQRGYSLDFSYGGSKITAVLSIYYENTKRFRSGVETAADGSTRFNIEDQYKAIELSTTNLNDYVYLVKELYDESSAAFVMKWITESFAEKIKKTKDVDYLNFYYKRLPDFVMERLSKYITKEEFLAHYILLEVRDDMDCFVDSSSAVLKLLRAFNDSKGLYQLFKQYPNEVKQLFFNLDKTSSFNGITLTNKMVFAVMVMALCFENKYEGFLNPFDPKNKEKIPTFTIGGDFKVDTNVRPGRDRYDNLYTMNQQQLKEYRELITAGHDGQWYETFKNYFNIKPPEYLHPLEPVFFIDMRPDPETGKPIDTTPVVVPAMYVKAIAHEQEVAEIMKLVRILADLLTIVIGAFTFGGSSFLYRAFTVLEIAIAANDLNVVANEDELMKTPEGRQYLDTWNKIALFGGLSMAAITLVRSAYKLGAFLLGKATMDGTNRFLKATIKELLEKRGATNYITGSIEVFTVAEAKVISGLGYTLTEIEELYSAGVAFIKGDLKAGNKITQEIGAAYNGSVIARGTAKEVKEILNGAKGSTLVAKLDDLFELARIDEAIKELGIVSILPKNPLSAAASIKKLEKIIKQLKSEKGSRAFNPAKDALKKLNVKLPASKAGTSVDFDGSSYLYKAAAGEKAIVKIKLTGKRGWDDDLAFKLAGINPTDDILENFTWHHLDDYDPVTQTTTVQLVESKIHTACYPHYGGVALAEKFLNFKYK